MSGSSVAHFAIIILLQSMHVHVPIVRGYNNVGVDPAISTRSLLAHQHPRPLPHPLLYPPPIATADLDGFHEVAG